MQNTTTEKNVPYSVVENTFCPIQRDTSLSSRNTNYLQNQLKQKAKTDFRVEYTYNQSHLLYRCDQLQAALAIAVWPSSVVREAGGPLLSVEDRIAQAAVVVIAVAYGMFVGVWNHAPKFMIFQKAVQLL